MNYQSEFKMCRCKDREECNCKKSFHGKPKWDSDDMRKNHCGQEKDHCPDKVKGFNLCRTRNELRCFKHCEPISQPCDGNARNYFTNRTNFEFSGLIVVTNTGNPTSGCPMDVTVTDRAGTDVVAVVFPGASVPIFVEGLISLEITCTPNPVTPPLTPTCSGEIIFDLEYCATKVCL